MSQWQECKLEEVAGVQTGPFGSQLHMSDYKLSGTPIITVEHIGDNRVIHSNLPLVGNEDLLRLKKYTLKTGDVVFSRVGSVDRCAYVSERENGWMFSGRLLRVRSKEGKVDPRFLSFYFSQESFKETVRMIAVGATMPSINTEILSNVEMRLPPLPEQRAIAGVLSSLDDKIDLLHRQNKTIESLAETLWRKMFVEDVKSCRSGYLNELVETTISGEWGKDDWTQDYSEKVFCIRGTDIDDLRFSIAERIPTRFVKPSKLEKIKPKPGDIILEISGGTEDQSTGRTIYINENIIGFFNSPVIYSNFCRLIRPVKKEFGYFLYLYCQLLYKQNEFFNLENGSSGIKNLDYKNLLTSLKINLPQNFSDIVDFNTDIQPLFQRIGLNRTQLRSLSRLRDSLLPKLMSGEVRVNL